MALIFMCITVHVEMREKMKELYSQFFAKLIGSLCNYQAHSSLVGSLSLISETDKELRHSSAQHRIQDNEPSLCSCF